MNADPRRYFSAPMLGNDGTFRVVSAVPVACALCGELHCSFINRMGRTRCVECDHQFLVTGEDVIRVHRRASAVASEVLP